MKHPSVLVVTRRTIRKNKYINYVGEFHLALLIRAGLLPVMVPVVDGAPAFLPEYMSGMRGLLLVEGADIEPKRYKARPENFTHLEKTHPLKDEIEIRLIRYALHKKLPILGICRGSQTRKRRMRRHALRRCAKRKKIPLKAHQFRALRQLQTSDFHRPGKPIEKWYGRTALRVNSYHHQGIRDLAHRFKPMAHAKDGLIEGYYDPKSDFVVGLQFHPERMLEEAAGNWRIWQAFRDAIYRKR